ncbi:MAG: glycosyltransferase family 117 protein [Anaerolineae bacterium]
MAILATLLAFIVYLITLAPGITWRNDGADGGDLITATVTGGVPHPSGYPTYLLLGSLFARLPFGDLAWRFNLMSAVGAACATGFTVLATLMSLQKMPQEGTHFHLMVAGVVGMTFAFSTLLWSQAVVAEVYSWNACFAAMVWYLMLRARVSHQLWLWPLAAYVFGLGLGNHLSLLALMPAGLVLFFASLDAEQGGSALLLSASRCAVWLLFALSAFAAGLAVYVVLPLRAAQKAPVNWGGADTWEGFIWLVTGQAYAPLVAALPLMHLPGRLLAALALLVRQVAWWGVPAAYLGVQMLWRHDRPVAIATSLSSLVLLSYAVGYNTSDSYVYLIPVGMMLMLWVAWGLADGLHRINLWAGVRFGSDRPIVTIMTRWGVLGLILIPLVINYQMVDASGDRRAHDFGVQALELVEEDALIVTEAAMDTFPLWYFHYAEGRRPDIILINGNLLAYEWYRDSIGRRYPLIELPPINDHPVQMVQRLVHTRLARGAVYVTTLHWPFPDDLRLVPAGVLYRVEKTP